MSSDLHEVEIQLSESAPYILDVLGSSRRSLGGALKSSVDLSKGRVFTWAPAGSQLPRNFSHGGLLAEAPPRTWHQTPRAVAKPVQNTSEALVAAVDGFLSGDARRLCLLANENVDPGDRVAASYPAKAVYGNELYHLITVGMGTDEIARILRTAVSVPVFVGVLSWSNVAVDSDKGVLTESLLQEIVANVEEIIIGAFDGEGFLVWRR